jgi:DNA-binding SARP family transcriptional activator
MRPFIQLLGVPCVLKAGLAATSIRGHKAWGLLTYLALHPGAVARQRLAGLLFEDALDPLAALRWNLRELRRALGDSTLRGDVISFPHEQVAGVDIAVLARGRWSEALPLAGLGRDLLEGLGFSSSPSFDAWLQSERRRMQATSQAVLREAALVQLAGGTPAEAVDLAYRLVGMNPLDENAHVLLVRCLAAAGDGLAAASRAAACRELFIRELGVAPGPALADALRTVTATPTALPAVGRVGAMAQLEAGEAAIGAGVLEAGLQCLRRAMVDADGTGDPVLRTRVRVALGGALVHAARGRDEEGAAALHEALAIGREAAPALAAAACRELGYVEFLGGRYQRALAWMTQAEPLAGDDLAERARIATVQGSILSDTAYYAAAMDMLRQAVAWAIEAGEPKQTIYAESMLGRALMLRGEVDAAQSVLEVAVEKARRLWTAFLPWPLSFQAETDLISGRLELAAERFEHAFALGCQLGDPCWEGIAGRGLGLMAMARGDAKQAEALLLSTLSRCARLPDIYLWGKAYVLESLCLLGLARGNAQTHKWVEELMDIAARSGMRELVVRAHLLRAALGDPAGTGAARMLALEIDNPVLSTLTGERDIGSPYSALHHPAIGMRYSAINTIPAGPSRSG